MSTTNLEKVETLKNMLVARATGESTLGDYGELRGELVNIPEVKVRLPKFVLTCRSLGEFWGFIKEQSGTYQERRNFLRDEFDSILTFLETGGIPSDDGLTEVLTTFDSEHVRAAWTKALERRETDPEGAITAARTLLETVCKHVLDEKGVEYKESTDLPKLYRLVAKELNLSPDQHSEEVFKQILGGCHAIVGGLGTLRNRLSDAHGKKKRAVRPLGRHAALAVNLAGTMATFLVQTLDANT